MTGPARSLPAHTPSETYLTLELSSTNLTGQWDVAVKDLQQGLKLDPERLARLSPGELEERLEAQTLDVLAHLLIKADDAPLSLKATDYTGVTLNNGEYVRVRFGSNARAAPGSLALDAQALFVLDPNMHGLFRLEHDGRTESVSFDGEHPAYRFELAGPSDRWGQWSSFIRQGIFHIWGGPDHILFLLSLLLPAVLHRQDQTWVGVKELRPAIGSVIKIVTAFTIAHSLTLSLAALDVVRLPSRLVESAIAISVLLAALNNVRPVVLGKSWMVAFLFGLVHGFGFASVLIEAGWTRQTLVLGLVGFNVGVEIGQLAIVAVFLPLAFALRASWFYRTIVLRLGSVAVALVATLWLIERVAGVSFMPF